MFHFYVPWKRQKTFVFCFQGVQKWNIDLQSVNKSNLNKY